MAFQFCCSCALVVQVLLWLIFGLGHADRLRRGVAHLHIFANLLWQSDGVALPAKKNISMQKKRQKRPSLCYLTLITWFHLRTPLLAQCDIALHQHRRNRYVPVMEALQAELDNRENFCTKTNLISTKGTIFLLALSNIIDAILRNVLYILL